MNNIMTAAELKDDIKFGLGGIYLFFGEEEYMKQHCYDFEAIQLLIQK